MGIKRGSMMASAGGHMASSTKLVSAIRRTSLGGNQCL
jgi:hypothetical protein